MLVVLQRHRCFVKVQYIGVFSASEEQCICHGLGIGVSEAFITFAGEKVFTPFSSQTNQRGLRVLKRIGNFVTQYPTDGGKQFG
ncbi:hypothetical protein PC39_04472 [Salinisphaera sp. PC39]